MTPTSDTRSPVEARHLDRAAALLVTWHDRDRLDPVEPTLGQRIALALADAERRTRDAVLRPIDDLFAGGPDTSCRTAWRREPGVLDVRTECVEVPLDDLRDALDAARQAAP